MPDLIKHVHKSSAGLKRLIDTFRDYWSRGHASVAEQLLPTATISKRQLEMKITTIAAKDQCTRLWIVRREVLEQYNITESDLSPKACVISKTSPTNLTPTGKSKQPKGASVKSIKEFFASPSETKNNVLTQSNHAFTPPPPSKKRRISLEPVIVLSEDENSKENCTRKEAWQGDPKVTLPPPKGIDWQEKVRERNKISVSIDIHI